MLPVFHTYMLTSIVYLFRTILILYYQNVDFLFSQFYMDNILTESNEKKFFSYLFNPLNSKKADILAIGFMVHLMKVIFRKYIITDYLK